jgi:hypothetical protein
VPKLVEPSDLARERARREAFARHDAAIARLKSYFNLTDYDLAVGRQQTDHSQDYR